jgi:hypothetical protein
LRKSDKWGGIKMKIKRQEEKKRNFEEYARKMLKRKGVPLSEKDDEKSE